MLKTREQHLQFCKDRAMKYVERNELTQAVQSMMSDLNKHPDTEGCLKGALGALGMSTLCMKNFIQAGSTHAPLGGRDFIGVWKKRPSI